MKKNKIKIDLDVIGTSGIIKEAEAELNIPDPDSSTAEKIFERENEHNDD